MMTNEIDCNEWSEMSQCIIQTGKYSVIENIEGREVKWFCLLLNENPKILKMIRMKRERGEMNNNQMMKIIMKKCLK